MVVVPIIECGGWDIEVVVVTMVVVAIVGNMPSK